MTITYPANQYPGIKNVTSVGISNLSTLTKLKSFSFNGYDKANSKFTDISGIIGVLSLENIELKNVNVGSLPDLSGLKNLKSITMSDGNLVNINGLNGCTKIDTIDFTNNSINNLFGIKELPLLKSLILNKNSIKAEALDSVNGTINNIDVLNYYDGKITTDKIDVRNNKFTDEDKTLLSWIILK